SGPLIAEIERLLPQTAAHRIPARLRRNEGRPVDEQRLRQNLSLCRLDLLLDLCRRALTEELELPHSEAALHAACFAGGARSNQRHLRRLLRRPGLHPANETWLAAHTDLNLDAWTHNPPVLQAERLTLRVETDPLEVVKMGTYARSCLALGGGLEYSA